MATVRPLQKLFPNNKKSLHNKSQPYIAPNYDDLEDDDDIYGEVRYPQFRIKNKPSSGEGSSNSYHNPLKTQPSTFTRSDPHTANNCHTIQKCPVSRPAPPLPRRAPPPLPFKPHHLRAEYNSNEAPPLPPRVVNRDAIIQRKQLTEEYFENIRQIMDGNDRLNGVMTSRSVRIPGTESRPYWTIEDSRAVMTPNDQVQPLPPRKNRPNDSQPPATTCQPSTTRKTPTLEAENASNEFIRSLTQLKHTSWYWSDMSWEDAELMLSTKEAINGSFLVRDSQDPHHILTLTVRSIESTYHHIRIEYSDGKFHLYEPTGNISEGAVSYCRHSNVIKFIELAVEQSISGTFIYFVKPKIMGEAPIQIRLLSPVSRFARVKSLQHNCRLVIRGVVPKYQIWKLPLPYHMVKYLQRSPYFDPKEDLPPQLQP